MLNRLIKVFLVIILAAIALAFAFPSSSALRLVCLVCSHKNSFFYAGKADYRLETK